MDADPHLPADPALREAAEMLEASRLAGEVFDDRWRIRFISTEQMQICGVDPETREQYYEMSLLARDYQYPEFALDRESAIHWLGLVVPYIRWDVSVDDPDFDEIFATAADRARLVEPLKPPVAFSVALGVQGAGTKLSWLGRYRLLYTRLHDSDGRFAGILSQTAPEIPQSLAFRLARGNTEMHERMDDLREPSRRPAAILFADLAASGELSRRLSSRAYFGLIRSLTDLIDDEVAARHGILGKHAGDGASALFLTDAETGGEGGAARGAVESARAIRDGARGLAAEDGPGILVKVGIHWGATLTIGQVSTRGRLEVTALGDEMNEAARIESAATGGVVLASKDLIERLSPADSEALSLEPDELTYQTVAELTGGEKEVRDAGAIAVVEV